MAPVTTPNQYQTDLKSFTYQDLMTWAQIKANNRFDEYAAAAAQYGVGEEEAMLQFLKGTGNGFGLDVQKMADGTYSGYIFNNPVDLPESNPLNSNAGTVSRATFREMVGQKFNDVEGTLVRNMTRYPSAGGLGQKASYVLGSIGSAVGAVSTGIWLGKTIDSALYNANPDFWNSIGLSSLDPATWGSLTNGSDSPFAGMLNFILGIDPDNGTAQMYLNQDALAYMAYVMNQAGVFDRGGWSTSQQAAIDAGVTLEHPNYTYNVYVNSTGCYGISYYGTTPRWTNSLQVISADSNVLYINICFGADPYSAPSEQWVISDAPFTAIMTQNTGSRSVEASTVAGTSFYAVNGYSNRKKYSPGATDYATNISPDVSFVYNASGELVKPTRNDVYKIAWYGSTETSAIEGIGDQTGATLPDTSTWDTPANTLTSLQQQYPDAFNNAMTWDNYADDGTPAQTTWVPVPFPTTTFANDTQPTSGTQTQTAINISDLPETLIKVITEIVQQTQTETEPKPATPPQNPVDTGTGEPPALVPITGSASALWSVYHPTQAQINDFGAWLWTDNVIEQFLRLMNNPMEGIISLHKVFGMPVDAGTGTIVVGRLDSNVSTALVTQQYIDVDCGTVSLYEQFANVFDYAPFTNVSLYLPFIGIVPLSVNDIMRSNINIHYGIDVFTGACLAQVRVTRDGNTVNMYQYSGVASVSYPLTGAQSNGLLSGLLGVAAGIGSVAAGNVAGLGMIATGAVSAAHTNMGRSGGFSGNAGAMGIKIPYLIIERPQTMVAQTFPDQQGYPTNYSATLGSYSGFVQCRALHCDGIAATQTEIAEIHNLLESGVIV